MRSPLQLTSALVLLLLPVISIQAAAAQQYSTVPFSGTFAGYAVYATPNNLNAATPALCPASAPRSADHWADVALRCCPSGQYGALASNGVVGCCLNGQTCTGAINGGPTTYLQPATTYYQPYYTPTTVIAVTTVVGGGGVVVPQATTVYQQGNPTTQYNGYCSTLRASGPNLPTTGQGQCGTILIIAGAAGWNRDWVKVMGLSFAIQGFFGLFVARVWF
ncbi:hypothetical protein LTR39_003717 [Cryomyces antarcticus]|nr:hypothetical protein LTR39_003717 [Cryomyces antarcticus]